MTCGHPVHELSALDRSEKVVYIKIYLQLVPHVTVYPSFMVIYYISQNDLWCPAVAGVLCNVCGAWKGKKDLTADFICQIQIIRFIFERENPSIL